MLRIIRNSSILFIIIICLTTISCARRSSTDGKAGSVREHNIYHGSKLAVLAGAAATLSEMPADSVITDYIREHPKTPVIESDSVFNLYWYGKAQRVLVNGDLQNGWAWPDTMKIVNTGEKKFFYISYKVPADSRLDYTLTVDSETVTDPRNPAITPSGYGPHSEVAMPGFKPDPFRLSREDIPHGSLDTLIFKDMDAFAVSMQLIVYLPPNYESLEKLPIIYVLTGPESLEYMSYQNVLDNLIADQRIEPVIAVFVPPAKNLPEIINERSGLILDAVCDKIVPMIDGKYKTDPRAGRRAITGISFSGHIALMALFSRSDVFRAAAGQSPSIFEREFKALQEMIRKNKYEQNMKLYLDYGTFDLPRSAIDDLNFLETGRKFDQALKMSGINHVYSEFNDGHEWANWRERTDDILLYFFGR